MVTKIEDHATVLFIGDSITDGGRDRENPDDLALKGFVQAAAAFFSAEYPEKRVKFLNRGLGGHTVKDLRNRWQADCIDLKPTWVSILIGINDCWKRYSENLIATPEEFENDYRFIITEAKEKLGARIILCEPFMLAVDAAKSSWREDLDPKIQIVRKLAREFNTIYIPYDGMFAQACAKREASFWSPDGVHPSQPGYALMAKAWFNAII